MTMKAGSAPGKPSLDVPLSSVTVFVGPNNSGKSRALQEIEMWITTPHYKEGTVIKSVEFEPWQADDLERAMQELEVAPRPNEAVNPGHVLIERFNARTNSTARHQLDKRSLLSQAQSPNGGRNYYCTLLSLFTLKLDGANRLALVNPMAAGDLLSSPANHLQYLFLNNDARMKLRQIAFEAFEKYLVIDPTQIGQLRLRLSPRAPLDEREEKGWDSTSVAFHRQAAPVVEASDGVKAFVGILSTIIAGEPKVTIIDEPEAFLHPALSFKLGKEVTTAMRATDKRLFVATHSASFLTGCVQAGAPINIVRLTYDYDTATARLLPPEQLAPLMRNPLLRSVGVLNALFYNAVVVTEADADRAFYQEINERLLAQNDRRGIASCLFLNAQNKQTVWDIVKPLRELGIPAAGVVDIDVLKEGGAVWMKPLEGAFLPALSHASLQADRKAILDAFTATPPKDMKRDGGIGLLSKDDQEACRSLFKRLAEYGVFVVERGELESWLPDLGVPRTKGTWLPTIFAKMGDEPGRANYLEPGEGDVWDFIGDIRSWAADANRKGIPE
jgi:energy-coupling factor transporter ATP-binding protein EcfA2